MTTQCGTSCDCCCDYSSEEEYVMYEPVLIERKETVPKKVVEKPKEVMAAVPKEPVFNPKTPEMCECQPHWAMEPKGEAPEWEPNEVIPAKPKKIKAKVDGWTQTEKEPSADFMIPHVNIHPSEPLPEADLGMDLPDQIPRAPKKKKAKVQEVSAAIEEEEETKMSIAYIERPVEREECCQRVQHVAVPVTQMVTQ